MWRFRIMGKLSQGTVNWIHNNAVDEGFLGDFYLIPKEAVDGKKD